MENNITVINELEAEIVIPQEPIRIKLTIDGQDAKITGIDESIKNFNNQILSLQTSIATLEARKIKEQEIKDNLIGQGLKTQAEVQIITEAREKAVAEELANNRLGELGNINPVE